MYLVRALLLITAKLNFHVTAAHLPGKTNSIADALSLSLQIPGIFPSSASRPADTSRNLQGSASQADLQSLDEQTAALLFQGLAKSTRRTYNTSQRRFFEFCYWSKRINSN